MPSYTTKITNIDKVYHTIAYFTLGVTWLFSYYKKPEKKYLIVICCIIFGIIIEVIQSKLTSYRSGDYLDVIANSFAIFLALLIFNLFSKKKKIN
ncbi:MAG: VanZ family protein [Polaribacter sp.]|nr:VanZ family protein [Polaribacter sp.]